MRRLRTPARTAPLAAAVVALFVAGIVAALLHDAPQQASVPRDAAPEQPAVTTTTASPPPISPTTTAGGAASGRPAEPGRSAAPGTATRVSAEERTRAGSGLAVAGGAEPGAGTMAETGGESLLVPGTALLAAALLARRAARRAAR